MLLFWVAYTFLYATALWSHLDVPGTLYINSVTARLGRPAMDLSHFLLSAGLPIANIPITPTNLSFTPILIEISAPTPTSTSTSTSTSTRIPTPNTIIFPASPLPTARLRHKALPFCYDGLHDDPKSATKPATRTVTGTTTDLIANGPGLITRYLLVSSALASALATHLVHSRACPVVICILGLVCVSRVLFMMRSSAFKTAATRTRISGHSPCSFGRDSSSREVSGDLVAAATSSPPSPPFTTPLKKLATMGPALTKTGRLIARKQKNRGRKQIPVKATGIPAVSRDNPPPIHPLNSPPRNIPPPKSVVTESRVWTVKGGSTIEYTPSVPRFLKRTSSVVKKFADVD